MKKRKITNKQERTKLVQKFLKSGQSQVMWCQTQGIAASTFSKWIHEYKSNSENTKFVMLTSEKTDSKSNKKSKSLEAVAPTKDALIEIGTCKIYVSEQMALTFMLKALEVNAPNV